MTEHALHAQPTRLGLHHRLQPSQKQFVGMRVLGRFVVGMIYHLTMAAVNAGFNDSGLLSSLDG
jgi:hypothetical protein